MKWLIKTVVKPWRPTMLGIIVVVLILFFGLPIRLSGPMERVEDDAIERVTLAACQKIEIGMTEENVKHILGIPGEKLTLLEKHADCEFSTRWYGNGFQFFVSYDANHKVTRVNTRVRRPGEFSC